MGGIPLRNYLLRDNCYDKKEEIIVVEGKL
jgi:hypothetical protein